MPKVLVLAFRFPPQAGMGAQRAVYAVRHLLECGWSAHVLTGPADAYPLRDDSLLDVLPASIPVTRTGLLDTAPTFRALGKLHLASLTRCLTPWFPLMKAGWIPHAYRAGRELLASQPFDLIFSSSQPMACHLTAYFLHERTGIPWVAEYRDEWSTRASMPWPTPLHRRLAQRLDRLITANADRVVTTSPAALDRFARLFPAPKPGHYVMAMSGFDESDFGDDEVSSPDTNHAGQFCLAYVGTLGRWKSLNQILAGVQGLVEAGRIPADRITVNYVGPTRSGEPDFAQLRAAGVLRTIGSVSHSEAVAWMRSAHALLLPNDEAHNIPGKTFEYLAAGRPILAVLPAGPAADLVRQANAGAVIAPKDQDAIVGEIVKMYEAWTRGRTPYRADRSVVRRFTWRETGRSLARAFDGTSDALAQAGLMRGSRAELQPRRAV